jgi:phage portal protein BeeE
MISKFLEGAKRGRNSKPIEVAAISGGSFGGGIGSGNGLYGYAYGAEGIDYNKEAGLRWDNGIAYAIISFLCTCVNGTPLMVAKRDKSGKLVPIPDHPALELLNDPNPWYDGTLLASAQVFEEAARGNSYVYKHRNPRTNALIAYEYLPEGTCVPYTWPGTGEFISEYRIATATGYYKVPPDDVLHMRWMTPNPVNPVYGMSPLDANLPNLVADNVAKRHEAVIIRNAGVSNVSVAPMIARDGQPQPVFTKEQREQLRDDIEDKITGDNKGRPMIWKLPVDFRQIGFDPKQLLLTEVRQMSQMEMCAGFHVQPVVIGLSAGLEKSNNRASIEGAIDITLDMGVLPYLRHRARQLTRDLIKTEMYGEPGEQILYDEAQIPEMRERLVKRLVEWTGGPIYSLNEGRAEAGLGPMEGGDSIRQSVATEADPVQSQAKPKKPVDKVSDTDTEIDNQEFDEP